jgi:hypothetical protein
VNWLPVISLAFQLGISNAIVARAFIGSSDVWFARMKSFFF